MTQIIHMHDYDSEYHPSMPVIEVGLSTPKNVAPVYITALVDSGADATIIPVKILKQINALYAGNRHMRGVTGSRQQVRIYYVLSVRGNI